MTNPSINDSNDEWVAAVNPGDYTHCNNNNSDEWTAAVDPADYTDLDESTTDVSVEKWETAANPEEYSHCINDTPDSDSAHLTDLSDNTDTTDTDISTDISPLTSPVIHGGHIDLNDVCTTHVLCNILNIFSDFERK